MSLRMRVVRRPRRTQRDHPRPVALRPNALGAAFRADGWELDPGAAFELDDLPAHTYDDDGESRLVPTTEVAVNESAAAAMRLQGLTPLLPRVDRASARCPGISSIAISPAALSGPWSAAD